MKYTLLELTQRILGSMEADEVSTIGETQESNDVVEIIRECYYDIVGQLNLAEHEGIFRLNASGDNTKPVLMTVPENIARFDSLRYNSAEDINDPIWTQLRFITNGEFWEMQSAMDVDDTDIDSMVVAINGQNMTVKYWNNRFPSCYTIFDERIVLFDSIDRTEEDTLTQTRSLGDGLIVPEFTKSDSFVPDLDPRQFQLLLQDAKSTAHVELKQAPNPKAEAKYRRNMINAQKHRDDKAKADTSQRRITFGRK